MKVCNYKTYFIDLPSVETIKNINKINLKKISPNVASKLNLSSENTIKEQKIKVAQEIEKSFSAYRNSANHHQSNSFENSRSLIKPRYEFKIGKLKAIRKMNQSAEPQKPEGNVNEYGYNLPIIENHRFNTFRDIKRVKHVTSPRIIRKIDSKNNENEEISSSYIRDDANSVLMKYGASSQAGSNPINPMKVNQDSFVMIEAKS